MSRILGCTHRSEFDRFATTKSGGQLMLSAGLFADSLTEVVHVYKDGPDAMYYYYPVLVLLIIIIVLSFVGIILSIVLGLNTYPSKKVKPGVNNEANDNANNEATEKPSPAECPPSLLIMNDTLTVITALVFILVATKSALRDNSPRPPLTQNPVPVLRSAINNTLT